MSEETIFAAASRKPMAERESYLVEACGRDAELRRNVERLLKAHDAAGGFLESPALGDDTKVYHSECETVGTRIGPYVLREQIGEGGFGHVFIAEQSEPVKRKVALKVIKPGMDSREVISRFEAERQALALMDHPNIARVLDAGATESGRPYFVMELVRGIPITEYCDKHQSPPRERLELFITVCQAIQHAHQKGIIHRDIKPSNVLVMSHDGKPVAKVIDFGVAKAIHQQLTNRSIYTNMAQMLGTPLYMSPEQAEMSGLDIDTRSDLYSLGVLLYELLTGTTPLDRTKFAKAAYDEVRRLIREEEPPKPSTRLSTSNSIASIAAQRHMEPAKLSRLIRGDLDWITMKALEKDRTRRYETANGLVRDIQRYLSDEPVEACPPSATYRLRKFARKNRVALTTVTAIGVLLVGGIAASTWQAVRATRAEAEARASAEAERQARQEAVNAAAAEKMAREQSQKRLTQIEKGNAIITAIFTDLDITRVREGTEPLEAVLAQRLVKAAGQLEGEAVGEQLIVAKLQDRLGESLRNLGYARDAIPFLIKARETRAARLGLDHPDTLTTMHHLAWAYQVAGKLDLAMPLYEETLQRRKITLGADHPDTLTSMHNLAWGYHSVRKLDLALALFDETLRLRKARLGADHAVTLNSMHMLARCYQALDKMDLALPLFEGSFKQKKATLGADHPQTLIAMHNLARGYHAAGKRDLALSLFEETLRLRKTKLGADHPHTLSSLHNLAWAHHEGGQRDLAQPLYEDVVRLRKARLGTNHSETLNSMYHLARCYFDNGKRDLALTLHEETLRLRKAALGADNNDTVASMYMLARCYLRVGTSDLAVPLLQDAAEIVEKGQFQYVHSNGVFSALIDLLKRLKQFDQAETWQRKWVARVRVVSGSTSLAYASELAPLGGLLLRQKKWADAEAVLRECLALREKSQPDAWQTFNTMSLLGGSLLGQKQYADAEPLLLKGYEGMKARKAKMQKSGSEPFLPETIDRLVELYTAMSRNVEAAKWQAERAKYKE